MEFTEDDKRRLDKVHDFLFGNGIPGVDERMRNIELYIQKQDEYRKEDRRDKRQLLIGLILTVLASLAGAITTIVLSSPR